MEYSGQIVSTQIARYGDKDTRYGYVTIETPEKNHVKIKVDADTSYDSLEIGKKVIVNSETLGDTSIIIAKQINTLS